MRTPRHLVLLPFLAVALVGPFPVRAEQAASGFPAELPRASGSGLTAADEERDARELAERINQALNLRREVTLTLFNDTAIIVSGRVTTQRYWLIITDHDGSEFRCRASLVAAVRIK